MTYREFEKKAHRVVFHIALLFILPIVGNVVLEIYYEVKKKREAEQKLQANYRSQ